MRALRTAAIVVLVAGAGVAGSLVVGHFLGMNAKDLWTLAMAMLPSFAGTVVAVLVAQRLLAKASIVWRSIAIAAVAVAVGLANLAVASRLMFVSPHDAQVVAILLAFSVAAGVGAAVALARSSRSGIRRLMGAARRLGDGDLSARVGPLDAEPDLRSLARTLDEMADRLSSAIELERAADASRRDLMTAVSHDLRTPLARIKAIAEGLERGVIDRPEEMRAYASDICTEVDALARLVDDLFDVVRVDSERASARTVRLQTALAPVLAAFEPVARQKRIRLRRELNGAGEAACPASIERVLHNLVGNAIRHTDEGEVTVHAECLGGELVIEVSDTGGGIPADQLPHVFEPFWRGDASRSSPGSGLGLTVARRLVEHVGGDITVSTEGGAGTTFRVTLPASAGGDPGPATRRRA